jgi:hypothetical protein
MVFEVILVALSCIVILSSYFSFCYFVCLVGEMSPSSNRQHHGIFGPQANSFHFGK